jgi:hypothetical protein
VRRLFFRLSPSNGTVRPEQRSFITRTERENEMQMVTTTIEDLHADVLACSLGRLDGRSRPNSARSSPAWRHHVRSASSSGRRSRATTPSLCAASSPTRTRSPPPTPAEERRTRPYSTSSSGCSLSPWWTCTAGVLPCIVGEQQRAVGERINRIVFHTYQWHCQLNIFNIFSLLKLSSIYTTFFIKAAL